MLFETEEVRAYPQAEPNDKILLVDADTIAFGACSVFEYEFYNIDKGNNEFGINIEDTINYAAEHVEKLLAMTGCKSAELYFTSGMHFRYTVNPTYKSNRDGLHRPPGLYEVKAGLLEQYEGKICTEWEADDEVVFLKKQNPDKYILCAVDKDVLNATAGKHFNYYSSKKFGIEPKWVEIAEDEAKTYNFLQAIMGDANDGVPGVPGIGKVGATKFVNNSMTELEMWQGVVKAYESKGLTIVDALITYQLVSMHQLVPDENGEPILKLFNPKELEDGD